MSFREKFTAIARYYGVLATVLVGVAMVIFSGNKLVTSITGAEWTAAVATPILLGAFWVPIKRVQANLASHPSWVRLEAEKDRQWWVENRIKRALPLPLKKRPRRTA